MFLEYFYYAFLIFQNTNYLLCICYLFSPSLVEIANTHQFQIEIISHHLHSLPNTVQMFIVVISFPASDPYSGRDTDLADLFLSPNMPSFLDDKHTQRCLANWLVHVFLYWYKMNFQPQFTKYSQSFRVL